MIHFFPSVITCNLTTITIHFKTNIFLSVNFIDFLERGNVPWQTQITHKYVHKFMTCEGADRFIVLSQQHTEITVIIAKALLKPWQQHNFCE